ncbi:glycosyltransferase family 39 protein [Candidatus Villigracilis affinis]|uniref:glycosyltransferase family 39 protein n=1 Tax=Candidatus Villigracilis affinis TaxID=3140682 RepID=UPI0031E6F8A5
MRRAVSPWAAVVAIAFILSCRFRCRPCRSFQPDPLMPAAFVAGIYFLYRWSEEQAWKWAILAGVFFGFCHVRQNCHRFFVGLLRLPWSFSRSKRFWKSKQVWAMAAIMVVPAFLFYILLNRGRSPNISSRGL